MRDYKQETERRVAFLRDALRTSGASGFVYGNSGGKDSALVGVLCKMACDNTLGILMPCASARNFGEDLRDGLEVAEHYGIETVQVDLTPARDALLAEISKVAAPCDAAVRNAAPRLRMTTLYTVAQSRGSLVVGTGNRSEAYVGYFTKWGDGAYDLNPISDLTVTEIYEFLAYLDAPLCVRTKAPSAGLFDGQTDEGELGFTYAQLDRYLLTGEGEEAVIAAIERKHAASAHKRAPSLTFAGGN